MAATIRKACTVAVFVCAALGGATAVAGAQPVIGTGPDGQVTVSAPPGQWWKCALYEGLPPHVTGLPPVVNYPSPEFSDRPFATPDATARFPSGTVVLVDCASADAPVLWLQLLRTE